MRNCLIRAGVFLLALAPGLTACGSHASLPVQSAQSAPRFEKPMDIVAGPSGYKLNVLLGDAAPNLGGNTLQRLDLGIMEIDAVENGEVSVLASFDTPRVVNVLAHQDDDGESVADGNVARSDYQQLRLVIDLASSYAKFRGGPRVPVDFLVNVASASSSGAGATTLTTSDGPGAVDMLVTQPFSIPAHQDHSVRVDFNAFESLAIDATGALVARASLFVAPMDDMGRVKGCVLDAYGSPVSNATVVAVAPDGSIGNSDWTDDSGRFSIGTLRSGTYKLLIYNSYTTAAGRVVTASGQTNSSQSFEGPTITVSPDKAVTAGTIAD